MSKSTFTYEPLGQSQAVVVLVGCQANLMSSVKDHSPKEYQNNILAHVALADTFNMPTIVAANDNNAFFRGVAGSSKAGEAFIKCNGEINPWDNEAFRNAINSSGKKQILLAGTPTDTTVSALALTLHGEDYLVYVNADACGASSTSSAEDAKSRMRGAGVRVMSMLAIASELASGLGAAGRASLNTFLEKYVPKYGYLVQADDAKQSST